MENSVATANKSRPRNTVMSIVKGMAIILMVAGHAEGGDMLVRFIYLFHMPVFSSLPDISFRSRVSTTPGDSA